MSRSPEFNKKKALTKATELFWKQGYRNTSVAQLMKVMRMGEGSFYNAFENKKRLYLECLRHYDAVFMAARRDAIHGEGAIRDRIGEFFEVVVADAESGPAGCLASNSLTNEVLKERECRDYLFSNFASFLDFLAGLIREGKKRGEFADEIRPVETARVLFTYLHGLHRLSVYEFDERKRLKETRALLDAVLPSRD